MSYACPGNDPNPVPPVFLQNFPPPAFSPPRGNDPNPVPPIFMQNFPPPFFSENIFSEHQAFSAALTRNRRNGDSPHVPRLNLPPQSRNLSNVRNLFGEEMSSRAASQDSRSGYGSPNRAERPSSNLQAVCVAEGTASFASSPNSRGFHETVYAVEGPLCKSRSLDLLAPVELQSSKYTPLANMSAQSDNHAKLCQDIVGGVVNGLKLEERHNDVMASLNAISLRLQALENPSPTQLQPTTEVSGSKVIAVQESRRANNMMVLSRPGIVKMETTPKADENWLHNMVMQVSSSLDKFSKDFQTENENMREILRNEVSLDEIATAVLDKLETKLIVNIDDSEAMRSLREMQEQLNEQVTADGSELVRSRRRMQEEVPEPNVVQAMLEAQYSDTSRMLQKILVGQLDQDAIADCIRREMTLLMRDFSQTSAQIVEAFTWIKENHKFMLKAVKNMESQASEVRTSYRPLDSWRKEFDFSEERVQRTIIRQENESPYEQPRSTPKRRVSFETQENGKRASSPGRAGSLSRPPTPKPNASRNGTSFVGDVDQEDAVFACICGYTCGTAKALERHLAKFAGVPGHTAVKEY